MSALDPVEQVALRHDIQPAEAQALIAVYDALRQAAQELRDQAATRFDEYGAGDARGAAMWDAGCHIDPDDRNAMGVPIP